MRGTSTRLDRKRSRIIGWESGPESNSGKTTRKLVDERYEPKSARFVTVTDSQ
jgi:hypothetical protein